MKRWLLPSTLLIAAFACFIGAILFAVYETPPLKGNWGDTIKQISIYLGVAAGLYAPFASILMAQYQAGLTRELERIKSSFSVELEIKKAIISAQVRAFEGMLNSANFYYFTIRQMVFAEAEKQGELMEEADKRAADATAGIWNLDKEDRMKWFEVYQRSIALAEAIRYAPQPDAEGLFNKDAPALGAAIEKLEEAGRTLFDDAIRAR